MPSLRNIADGWRTGTRRSQYQVLAVMVLLVAASLAISLQSYDLFPLAGYFLWLLVGAMLLRFGPLLWLAIAVSAAAMLALFTQDSVEGTRHLALLFFGLSVCLVLYAASRQRSGLPSPLSSALLADLRDRLNARGTVPPLPAGWRAQSAMVAAFGVGYAGDFMVADLDQETGQLDLVLVDVVGKGVKAAPSALLLAGALGGLVGAVRGQAVFEAANTFLLRQDIEETFATAVHVSIDLVSGHYTILSAGHPPALRWSPATDAWLVDNSRGLALGIVPHPEIVASHGVLEPGEALLFYTDGVVETRGADLDSGISWLQETARIALKRGVEGAARRIVRQVPRGDDDRALLILSRDPSTTA